jgi:acyl-CoA synthetase (AMP-forming)/AMP-acid ligase II
MAEGFGIHQAKFQCEQREGIQNMYRDIRITDAATVWEALHKAAEEMPEKAAYIYEDRPISFSELDAATDRVASQLLRLGYRKGDRIGIIGLNQPEWLYTYFAAAKIGAVVVGLNVRYRDSELEYIINQSETRGLVCMSRTTEMDYIEFFDSFRSKIPSVKEFFFIGGEGFDGSLRFESLVHSESDPDALAKARAAVDPTDLMIIIYTSGTTGLPKGAAITHKSQLAAAHAQAEHVRISPDDLLPICLPLNHVGGISCGILTALLGKATVILVPQFDPEEIIRLCEKYRPTIWAGVPTMHILLLMHQDIDSLDTSNFRLIITGGANAEPALLNNLKSTFPDAALMNLYGLSEASGALVLSPWDSDFDTLVRSIGRPIGDFEVKAVGTQAAEVPIGETGELYFRGDAVAAGYFRMPEATRQTFDSDGWLHTGDMGYIDMNGNIFLMGRLKEMYIQGGYNVYPVEVENLLSKHPKVAMAAGIGVPDPVLGEVGRYYIVPKPGAEPTEEEIREYCKKHLANYKVPRQIVFRSWLPLTPVGKIMKSKLLEE